MDAYAVFPNRMGEPAFCGESGPGGYEGRVERRRRVVVDGESRRLR